MGEVIRNFTGRQAELDKLHEMLTRFQSQNSRSSAANFVCISGLGGVGKPSLARKYAFCHWSSFDGNVVWINGETLESMRSSFMRLAEQLSLKIVEQASCSNHELAANVYRQFRDKKVLFIVDNVEEKEHWKEFQPRITHAADVVPLVLMTTRRTDLAPLPQNALPLDVLTADESVALVLRQLPHVRPKDAAKLVGTLHCLPLALQQALAYIANTYLDSDVDSIPKYLARFRDAERELLNDDRFQDEYDSDYAMTTYTTWLITFERIQESRGDEGATKLLRELAFMNPDHISLDFVASVSGADPSPSLKLLQRFSMVQVNEGRVLVNRLVHWVVRLALVAEEEIMAPMFAIVSVIEKELHGDDVKYTDRARECKSHGLYLFRFQTQYPAELLQEKSGYVSNLCAHLIAYGNYTESVEVSQRATSLYASLNGKGHENTLQMKTKTADACLRMWGLPRRSGF